MADLIGMGNLVLGGASLIANKQEQKRNREYNLKLAQMQNQMNVEQWQRENEYNLPINQLKRLQEAGINPDMVYGGGIQNTSASSPTMTSGAPSSPMDWSPMASIVNNAVHAQLDADYKQAQIDNLNADTKNKGYEGSILASDAAFRDAWNQGQINLQHVQIDVSLSARNLNEANTNYIREDIRRIDALVNNLNASTQQVYNAVVNDNARLDLEKAFSDANLKKISSETSVNYATIEKYAKELEIQLKQWQTNENTQIKLRELYTSQKGLTESQKSGQDHTNGLIEINKGIASFKKEIVTQSPKEWLMSSEQYIRVHEDLFKAILSTM